MRTRNVERGAIGRNVICWCGSGKKYKHCHLYRGDQEPLPAWRRGEQLRAEFSRPECLHPEAGAGKCKGGIVRAHTVRRSADLGRIAEGGHVYTSLPQRLGEQGPTLVGIGRASTFSGFCAEHDRLAFEPIETHPLQFTKKQLHRLFYRPLIHELYKKQALKRLVPTIRESDRGQIAALQLAIQRRISDFETGVEIANQDFVFYKQLYDADFTADTYERMRGAIVHLDRVPDVMCAGFVQPTMSFSGEQLWDLANLERYPPAVAFSLVAMEADAGAAIFTWGEESRGPADALVRSLLKLERARIPEAIVRYAFETIENAYFRRSWWAAQQPETKAVLVRRMRSGLGGEEPDLAEDGMQTVAWNVTRIEVVGDCDVTLR
jgi:hypothetical protein